MRRCASLQRSSASESTPTSHTTTSSAGSSCASATLPTSLVLFTADGDADFIGRGFHGSLVCDKLEKTYEELVAKGVEFITPPTKAPWGSFAVFKDIDGNRFVMSAA